MDAQEKRKQKNSIAKYPFYFSFFSSSLLFLLSRLAVLLYTSKEKKILVLQTNDFHYFLFP